MPSGGKQTDLQHSQKASWVIQCIRVTQSILIWPLGRSAGERAPVVCVETPDCDAVEEELQRANRSHSTGCLTGCRPRCFPSCLSCQPLGIESGMRTWWTTLSVERTQGNIHIVKDVPWMSRHFRPFKEYYKLILTFTFFFIQKSLFKLMHDALNIIVNFWWLILIWNYLSETDKPRFKGGLTDHLTWPNNI